MRGRKLLVDQEESQLLQHYEFLWTMVFRGLRDGSPEEEEDVATNRFPAMLIKSNGRDRESLTTILPGKGRHGVSALKDVAKDQIFRNKVQKKEKEFEEFTGLTSERTMRVDIPRSHMNAHYGAAHVRAARLAFALVARRGVELPLGGTDLFLPSFLIDMESLFEEYVSRVLAQYLAGFQVVGVNESMKPLFEDKEAPLANPDLVIFRNAVPLCVGDVKYKLRYTREDLNQVISYAVSYGVEVAILFLPALSADDVGLRLVGTIKGIRIYQYTLWLGSDRLSQSAEQMASAVAAVVSA